MLTYLLFYNLEKRLFLLKNQRVTFPSVIFITSILHLITYCTQLFINIKVSMFLNIMFHAPMGRFQLDQNFELPLFSVFTVVQFNCCVHSCRPFAAITSSAGLIGCRGSYCWTPTFNYQGRATVETPTPNKICRRCCNSNERPTGMNTTIVCDDCEKWKTIIQSFVSM